MIKDQGVVMLLKEFVVHVEEIAVFNGLRVELVRLIDESEFLVYEV